MWKSISGWVSHQVRSVRNRLDREGGLPFSELLPGMKCESVIRQAGDTQHSSTAHRLANDPVATAKANLPSPLSRYICAAVLSVAAALKAYEIVTDPSVGILHGSRLLYLAVIEGELLLAVWLASGIAAIWSRRVAIGVFVAFGCYAIYLAATGAQTCGCFGRVQINPCTRC